MPENTTLGLLAPIKYKNICPFPWQERWELRARPFGCNCSTTTLLTGVFTFLSTIAGLLVLVGLVKFIALVWTTVRGGEGFELEVEGERRWGHPWNRTRTWKEWRQSWWWPKKTEKGDLIIEESDEETPLLG